MPLPKQSENLNYTVESAPSYMQLGDGSFVKDGYLVNRRTDTMEVLGKVTDRYGIIQNSDLVSAAEEAFDKNGLANYTRKIVVTGSGEKMYAIYDFKNITRKLKVGDEVGMRLMVQNSFNGVLRASFALGTLRLVCLNGATTLEKEVGLTQKHSSNINTKFISDSLEKAIGRWEHSLELFDRLSLISITQAQGSNILANLQKQTVFSKKLRESIEGIWNAPTYAEDSGRNLFNLYNAATQHLTHNVAQTRFDLSNRVSSDMLSVLEKASRDTGKLNKLFAPVALPEVSELSLN